jgi:hypothetical protein
MSEEKKLSELIFGALSDKERDDLLDLEDEFEMWKESRRERFLKSSGEDNDAEKPKK